MLAGGRGSRLGGIEKADLLLHGRPLLEHLLEQLTVPVIVVGPDRATAGPARFVLEEPRYGGPVAGLRAAVDLVETPVVAVLAVDLPYAVPLVEILVESFTEEMQVLVPVRDGHEEYVCSVFDLHSLRHGLQECGDSMRSLFAALDVTRLEVSAEQGLMLRDVDTPADLESLERDPGD